MASRQGRNSAASCGPDRLGRHRGEVARAKSTGNRISRLFHRERGGGVACAGPYVSSTNDPPADAPELTVNGGSANWRTNLAGQPLYPFWPLDVTALDLPP